MALKDFLSDLVAEMAGEFFGVKMLKGIITKAIASKSGTILEKGSQAPGQEKTTVVPESKWGGIFDLSDETAYMSLVAKMSAEPTIAGMVKKVSAFINSSHFSPGQARRFRVIIGSLSNITYTKELLKERKEIPRQKGRPIVEEKTREIKTNLGLEFIRSFAQLTQTQMLEVCKASGLMDSAFDGIPRGIEAGVKAISQFAEKIEKSNGAQKVMNTLADKMRARINYLK